MPSRSKAPLIAFGFLFGACLFCSWVWFKTDIGRANSHLQSPSSEPRIWLTARTNIPGYMFIEEPITDVVKTTIGTSNILSGTFYKVTDSGRETAERSPDSDFQSPVNKPKNGRNLGSSDRQTDRLASNLPSPLISASRITVFFATWPSDDNSGLEVVRHTPDFCWGNAGWKPINLGQPMQIPLQIYTSKEPTRQEAEIPGALNRLDQSESPVLEAKTEVPFDFRIFELSDAQSREAVVWCAFSGGQALVETVEWAKQAPSTNSVAYGFWSRALRHKQILRAERQFPIFGEKQFVRFSMKSQGEWHRTSEELITFGAAWLLRRDCKREIQ